MKMFMSLTATTTMRAPETVTQRTPQPSQMTTTTTTMTKPPVKANTENSAKTKNFAIICGSIALVVILITTVAFIKIAKKRGVKNNELKEEMNDLYGTYSQGTEYNTATEDNPR